MEPPDARASLHRLIGEAVMRSARIQEQCRASVAELEDSFAALERTMGEIRRTRARIPAFGNGQLDAQDREGAG